MAAGVGQLPLGRQNEPGPLAGAWDSSEEAGPLAGACEEETLGLTDLAWEALCKHLESFFHSSSVHSEQTSQGVEGEQE